MKRLLKRLLPVFLMCWTVPVWAACPSRSFTYTAGETIEPSEVTTNEDNLYNYTCSGVDTYRNNSITTTALQDSAVTSVKINDDTITVGDVADGDWGDITISSNSATLDAGVVNADELASTVALSDGDLLDLDAINVSSVTEGLLLPQAASCASGTAEGQLCWDTNNDLLYVGDGTTAAALSTYFVGQFTRDTSTATGTQAVTGVGFTPKAVFFLSAQDGAAGEMSVGYDDGTSSQAVRDDNGELTDTWTGSASFSINDNQSTGNVYTGEITTLGTDGFTITWTRTGTPTGTLSVNYLAMR